MFTLRKTAFIKLFILIIGLGATCLIGQYLTEDGFYALSEESLTTTEQFKDYLDAASQEVWERLETTTNVTHADCVKYLEEYGDSMREYIKKENKERAQPLETINQETLDLVAQLMLEYGLDCNSVEIIATKEGDSPAAANEFTLYINPTLLSTFPQESHRFIFAHEMSHMKYKDTSIRTALLNLLDTDNNEEHNNCIEAFGDFTEIRADMNAMLLGKEYALGGIAFFEDYIKTYGDEKYPFHPRPSNRLKIAQKIAATYENKISEQKAAT